MISLQKIANTDNNNLPHISPLLASAASKVSSRPVNSRDKFSMKSQARSYVNLNEEQTKAIKNKTRDKILSLSLLALQISLIAAAVMSFLFLNLALPLIITIGLVSIILSGIPTSIMHKDLGAPLISEIAFVIFAFRPKRFDRKIEQGQKECTLINQEITTIKTHSKAIREQIKSQINAEISKQDPNPQLLSELAQSLVNLKKIEAL